MDKTYTYTPHDTFILNPNSLGFHKGEIKMQVLLK